VRSEAQNKRRGHGSSGGDYRKKRLTSQTWKGRGGFLEAGGRRLGSGTRNGPGRNSEILKLARRGEKGA